MTSKYGTTLVRTIAALAVCTSNAFAQADDGCGSLQNGYGPYDYRKDQDKLHVVDAYHFTPSIESLTKGNTGSIGADLDYTLRAAPNHHRALVATVRYAAQANADTAPNMPRTVECYLRRAVRFTPDDEVARMLLASYLGTHGKLEEALYHLERTRKQAKESGFTQFNVGLIYLELKQYDLALAQAHEAMRLGFTRPQLKSGLEQAGHWKEPAAAGDAPATSASAAASASRPTQ